MVSFTADQQKILPRERLQDLVSEVSAISAICREHEGTYEQHFDPPDIKIILKIIDDANDALDALRKIVKAPLKRLQKKEERKDLLNEVRFKLMQVQSGYRIWQPHFNAGSENLLKANLAYLFDPYRPFGGIGDLKAGEIAEHRRRTLLHLEPEVQIKWLAIFSLRRWTREIPEDLFGLLLAEVQNINLIAWPEETLADLTEIWSSRDFRDSVGFLKILSAFEDRANRSHRDFDMGPQMTLEALR